MSQVNEPDIVRGVVYAAVSGDALAFARIVERHDDDMVRIAYLVTRDVELAHEAVQSAWEIAWRKIGSLRDEDRLRSWLASIAANEGRQLLRRRRRQVVREIPIQTPGWDKGQPQRHENVDLMNALAALSAEDRAIIAMRYVLGLTSTEIGRSAGLSAAGVRSRLARAVARLRKDLGDV